MTGSSAPRLKRDRGAAAVEFALLLPVLVALILGIIEFGYAFFVWGNVAGAAREGARNYAITKNEAQAKTAAKSAFPALGDADIGVSPAPSSCRDGAPATVTITYSYSTLTGLLEGITGAKTLSLQGKGTMRCGG